MNADFAPGDRAYVLHEGWHPSGHRYLDASPIFVVHAVEDGRLIVADGTSVTISDSVRKVPADTPVVGQTVYVQGNLYRDHFRGGRATVSKVEMGMSAGELVPFVAIAERPGWLYNWTFLGGEQGALAAQYGDSRAYSYLS